MRTPFPVRLSILEPSALVKRVLRHYELRGPLTCRFFRRSVSDVYQVQAAGRTFYLKVSMHGRRSRRDVEEEVHLLRYLRRNGVRVKRPVRRKDGRFVNEILAPEGIRYAVLFTAARGAQLNRSSPKDCQELGRMVARMHCVADRIRRKYLRPVIDLAHLVDEQLDTIRPFMTHRKDDFEVISSIGRSVRSRVEELLERKGPAFGICHGDLHGEDVRVDANGIPTILDFDSCGYGWRSIDIGVFPACHRWMDDSDEAAAERKRLRDDFLKGYQSLRRLSKGEIEVVDLCPPVWHIFLMGIVFKFAAENVGCHWADDNYFDWQMRWFRGWPQNHLTE